MSPNSSAITLRCVSVNVESLSLEPLFSRGGALVDSARADAQFVHWYNGISDVMGLNQVRRFKVLSIVRQKPYSQLEETSSLPKRGLKQRDVVADARSFLRLLNAESLVIQQTVYDSHLSLIVSQYKGTEEVSLRLRPVTKIRELNHRFPEYLCSLWVSSFVTEKHTVTYSTAGDRSALKSDLLMSLGSKRIYRCRPHSQILCVQARSAVQQENSFYRSLRLRTIDSAAIANSLSQFPDTPRKKVESSLNQTHTDNDSNDDAVANKVEATTPSPTAGPNPGEHDENQARPNPGDATSSQPPLSHVFHAGPNLEHMDLEASDTSIQPNHKQKELDRYEHIHHTHNRPILTAYPDVQPRTFTTPTDTQRKNKKPVHEDLAPQLRTLSLLLHIFHQPRAPTQPQLSLIFSSPAVEDHRQDGINA
ncbi:hypothetical protein Tco_0409210 [Tanacetum coccineum]